MFYLGMDVAKAKLDCCLLLDEASGKRKTKVVNNTKSGIADLLARIADNTFLQRNCMSSWKTLASTTNKRPWHWRMPVSRFPSSIPRKSKTSGVDWRCATKTDGVDSFVLARYGALLKPAARVPPAPEARMLQALLSRREAIAQDLQRERNRQEKAHATDTPERIRQSLSDSIEFLVKQLAEFQQDIDQHIDRHPSLKDDMAWRRSIPAVGPQVGGNLLSVMHSHDFDSAEQLAAYLGLVPVERQSGSSVLGRARLSKAGPARIRAVLYMAAIVATRHNPHVKTVYERLLARGKSKMSALGAAMRKLVHLCFGVLKTRKPYRPDYAKIA